MSLPFISVCIPSYKRTSLLKRLLDSIRQQTYNNYEVIISDDSPDNSVKDLADSFSGLKLNYFRNVPAAGTPENWNLAVHKAKGEWIKLMHDDDWFATPGALQKMADVAENSKADFIFSACTYINENGKSNKAVIGDKELNELQSDHLYLLYDNIIGHPSTTLYRKDEDLEYNKRYKWVVDISFYINYLNKHSDLTYMPEPLINIGTGGSQVSIDCYKNPNVEIPEYFNLISSFGEENTAGDKYVFFCLWNLAKKFRLKTRQQILDYYQGPVPVVMDKIMASQKAIPRIILKQTPWSKYLMNKAYGKMVF